MNIQKLETGFVLQMESTRATIDRSIPTKFFTPESEYALEDKIRKTFESMVKQYSNEKEETLPMHWADLVSKHGLLLADKNNMPLTFHLYNAIRIDDAVFFSTGEKYINL